MNLNINDFSGPLDVLLHMVKRHEMNIYEVDLKIIIDEYIDFMKNLENEDLDSKSEYLIMASELIHLKSKILLGYDDEEKENEEFELNNEEDLRNRLIEFEKYQKTVDSFRNLEINRQDYFTKVPESLKEYKQKEVYSGEMEVTDLLNAFLELQKRLDYQKPKVTKITHKELSLKDKVSYIRKKLTDKNKLELFELFDNFSKEELVVTFLAILEMGKNKEVVLSQNKNFSKIFIEGIKHE